MVGVKHNLIFVAQYTDRYCFDILGWRSDNTIVMESILSLWCYYDVIPISETENCIIAILIITTHSIYYLLCVFYWDKCFACIFYLIIWQSLLLNTASVFILVQDNLTIRRQIWGWNVFIASQSLIVTIKYFSYKVLAIIS